MLSEACHLPLLPTSHSPKFWTSAGRRKDHIIKMHILKKNYKIETRTVCYSLINYHPPQQNKIHLNKKKASKSLHPFPPFIWNFLKVKPRKNTKTITYSNSTMTGHPVDVFENFTRINLSLSDKCTPAYHTRFGVSKCMWKNIFRKHYGVTL